MKDFAPKASPNIKTNTVYEPGLVSVIIPTYNRSKLVTRAIDSALQQTYPNCEIIVVDDGSTDDTCEVLASYKDRIKYIYQENSGHAAARNTGIRAARGKWVAFLDSDDIWLPEKLSRQIEILRSSSAKVCYTNVFWNTGEGQSSEENQLQDKDNKGSVKVFDEPFDLLLFEPTSQCMITLVVERDLLIHVGCFDELINRHVDVRLCFRLAFETPFAYVNETLAVADRQPGLERVSVKYSEGFASCCGDAITRSAAYLQSGSKSKRIIKELRHQLGHYVSKMALCACVENNNSAARRFALDGLYFGGSWRTYRRCIAVLLCPWLVKRLGTQV
jgi:glycosyltransferase involved in cell wall biosynthesis